VSRAISLGIVHRPTRPPVSPPGVESDQPLLLVVGGTPGPCRDEVMRELIAHRQPYVFAPVPQLDADDHWARWHTGPMMAVLADPAPADWLIPKELGIISIVVQSAPPRPAAIANALRNGARSLIWRQDLAKDLLAVVPLVARGYLAVSPGPLGVPCLVAVRGTWNLSALPELSARERQILHHVALGHTIQQSARALGIAVKTVENTRTRLFRKLGARNRSDAVLIASRMGLVDLAIQNQESVS
jgi:DNA-binding CsgD family transcriptional regulator